MRTLGRLVVVVVMVGPMVSCSKSATPADVELSSPERFTLDYAELMRGRQPAWLVTIEKDLELRVGKTVSDSWNVFLTNAYETYKEDPTARQEVLASYVESMIASVAEGDGEIDPSRIIPVVRYRAWPDEMRRGALSRGGEASEFVVEEFTQELVVVYADDTPSRVRYFSPEDLEQLGIPRSALLALAVKNLRRLLPPVELRPEGDMYFVTADGFHEASLLLFDDLWADRGFDVEGEVVVAIPSRGTLLVTGSDSPAGIQKVRALAEEISGTGAYRLTATLFVYRGGKFTRFD